MSKATAPATCGETADRSGKLARGRGLYASRGSHIRFCGRPFRTAVLGNILIGRTNGDNAGAVSRLREAGCICFYAQIWPREKRVNRVSEDTAVVAGSTSMKTVTTEAAFTGSRQLHRSLVKITANRCRWRLERHN